MGPENSCKVLKFKFLFFRPGKVLKLDTGAEKNPDFVICDPEKLNHLSRLQLHDLIIDGE